MAGLQLVAREKRLLEERLTAATGAERLREFDRQYGRHNGHRLRSRDRLYWQRRQGVNNVVCIFCKCVPDGIKDLGWHGKYVAAAVVI